IAAGADFIRKNFQATLDNILNTPIEPIHIPYVNISYVVQNLTADFKLEAGRMLLIIKGHAHTPHWWAPDFDFTAKQPLTLTPSGPVAELVVGSMSFDTSS